ncbi:glutamate--cysteine ligase, partial [Acinetobacter baumannii]|nr:glutamate--cysteine ligase [Acinetobacter baumannii]
MGANSPYLFGKHLQAETRIELFKQATDTRPPEIASQGVRPLVTFGERWVTSIFDLFEENVRYFSPLLPEDRTASGEPIIEGQSPTLHHLNLHNGTVWRWNRPIYAPGKQRAHIRVENRILPAGPTATD